LDVQDLFRVCVYCPKDISEYLYQNTSHQLL
jgi:hypothetical protein